MAITVGGMDRGLYIAASGMLAEQVRQDQLASDLANASTPGYKGHRSAQAQAFGEVLLAERSSGRPIGGQGLGVQIAEIVVDERPGAIRDTGEAYDFAIVGEGWFAVQTDNGVRYTRNGQFGLGPDGTLITAAGDPVLGRGGQRIRVARDGTVDPAQLQIVALNNMRKEGETLVTGTPAGAADGVVRAGALEGAGSDPARTMVEMIVSMRSFESGQRVLQTIDESLRKAAGQVGSLSA